MRSIFIAALFLSVSLYGQKKVTPVVNGKTTGEATYRNTNNDQFMRSWSLAGPVKMNTKESADPLSADQEKFFDEENVSTASLATATSMPSMTEQKLQWRAYVSKTDQIDLDSIYGKADFAAAYAFCEILADSAFSTFLEIGSDDAVKVWLNGKQVHRNWVGRALTPNEDFVPVTLQKGRNTLLIKVYDMKGGWGFTTKFINKADLADRLATAARKGDLDGVDMLLKAGAPIDKPGQSGLTAMQAAELNGREDVVNIFVSKGAKKTALPAPEVLIGDMYKSLNGNTAPGIAILVTQNGNPVYSKEFGYAEIESKTPVSAQSKFRIGSITKQFTASAILRLQEEGKLKVTDKLSRFYPDFPGAENVTIHQLLTHTSGIHSYTGKTDFTARVSTPITTDSLISYFRNDPYDFKPGDEYRYNNSGYFLLGAIIEKVSGKTYGSYLKEQFFDPIGMNNTGVYTSALKLENEAKGYSKSGNSYPRAANWDMSWAGGAGALYSTTGDLQKWNEAVFSGKVLKEESMKAALTSVVLNNGKTPSSGEYGYGWGMSNYRGRKIIQHSGGLDGFISQLAYFPDDKLTVIMLTNVTPPQVNVNPSSIAEIFLWDKMDKQPSYSAMKSSSQDLKIYEGRYQFPNAMVMIVTTDGKDLYAQLSGQAKFQIFPSAPDEFFWKVVEAKIKFNKNEKGEVTSGHFAQGGNEFDVPRIKEETIISVDPAVYKSYLGKYDFGNGMVLVVSTEGDKIFVQATNQPRFEMFPVAPKEFILKEITARVIFHSNTDGKVTKLTVDAAGEKKECLKLE